MLGLAGETELGLLLLLLALHAGCVAACCKCCSILGSSVGSFALHSIYYVCVYLPVAGYFHCQIYFKWVQLSAQRFLFAFRICSPRLFPLLSSFLPFRAKMLRSLRIFHTHTQRRQGCTATDTFAVTDTDTSAVAVALL